MASRDRLNIWPDGTKVVAASINSTDPNDIWGVLRNAVLINVFLHGWTFRVFVSSKFSLSERTLNKLLSLGASVHHVPAPVPDFVPTRLWTYLIADDPTVEYFVIMHPWQRLNHRDTIGIQHWISSTDSTDSTIYCGRNLSPSVRRTTLVEYWGARREPFSQRLPNSMLSLILSNFRNSTLESMQAATDQIWERFLSPFIQGEICTQTGQSALYSSDDSVAVYNQYEMVIPRQEGY